MYVHIDTSNPATVEDALESAPIGTRARVTTANGETFDITRCPGGWAVPDDLPVTSRDIADARPSAVSLDEDDR
jgi:hypothetical protein